MHSGAPFSAEGLRNLSVTKKTNKKFYNRASALFLNRGTHAERWPVRDRKIVSQLFVIFLKNLSGNRKTKLLFCRELIVTFRKRVSAFSASVIKSLSSLLFRCTQRHNEICCKSGFKIDRKTQKQLLTFLSTFPVTCC